MKIQADSMHGVYAVRSFDDSTEVMDEALFYRCLRDLPADSMIGTEASPTMIEKVIREYGIAARAGGVSMISAARALGSRGGSVHSEAQKAAARAAGKAPVKPGSAPRGRPSSKKPESMR